MLKTFTTLTEMFIKLKRRLNAYKRVADRFG